MVVNRTPRVGDRAGGHTRNGLQPRIIPKKRRGAKHPEGADAKNQSTPAQQRLIRANGTGPDPSYRRGRAGRTATRKSRQPL